ncbi:MAG: hypothetical protein L6R42_006366, partial [Xanthoria sp. 1 TBL-2021]
LQIMRQTAINESKKRADILYQEKLTALGNTKKQNNERVRAARKLIEQIEGAAPVLLRPKRQKQPGTRLFPPHTNTGSTNTSIGHPALTRTGFVDASSPEMDSSTTATAHGSLTYPGFVDTRPTEMGSTAITIVHARLTYAGANSDIAFPGPIHPGLGANTDIVAG